RAHFGATINFQAGTSRRAPVWMQNCGLEWLWRIKEEPKLWRRYFGDGAVLLQVILTQVLPLLVLKRWDELRQGHADEIRIDRHEARDLLLLAITGGATNGNVAKVAHHLKTAAAAE